MASSRSDDAPEAPPGASEEHSSASGAPSGRRAGIRGSITVGLVAALAGALFATNASLFRTGGARHPENLADLVSVESSRLAAASDEVAALRAEVSGLIAAAQGRAPAVPPPGPAVDVASGRVAVSGPGLTVRLWDAPTDSAPLGARPDDLVVHQQDLVGVMNALWAGGAEAMTIQGNRVTSSTAVRCVGTVLLMAAQTYSPPYEVAVVGDPERLLAALDASPSVQVYLQYVEALRLGWSVETQELIELPAAEGTTIQHAAVTDDGGGR